jgi:hypothetical protein
VATASDGESQVFGSSLRMPDPATRTSVLALASGSRLEVHPHHSLLVCEVTRVVANSEIHIRYVQGVQRGTGVWTFEPSDEGTRLCYRVELEPQGWIPRLLSHFVDFTAMHSRLMEKVFDGLEKWLLGKAS